MTGPVLVDHSAWSRLDRRTLPEARIDELAEAAEAGHLVACTPFLLEAGYSARNRADHEELLERLGRLPAVALDAAVERRALDAQHQLVRTGHHRLPPVDLLIAALADRHGLGVLHYDADYDVIREHTGLRFESVWLAERGTL